MVAGPSTQAVLLSAHTLMLNRVEVLLDRPSLYEAYV